MANRDLLKEAIADAKAVKETAIANAKSALEEAFTPFLKEKFAAKLAEMEEEEMNEADEKMDEAKEEVEEGKAEEVTEVEDMDEAEDMEEAKDLDEMDLDELLAELDAELNESEDMDEGKEMDEALDTINDPDTPEAKGNMAEAEEEEGEEEGGEEAEDEEIDLEDMSEEDLKKFIEDVIEDMVKTGELEAGESFEDDVDVEVDAEGEIEVEDDEMTSVDMAEGEDIDEAKDMEEGYDVDEAKEMDEMKREIEELRSELNEINILNSKLLYVNKIFRSRNLTENQKAKVLGAFDKAQTVAEVKLVFETLNEGLTTKKAAIKENLGSASKVMGSAPTKKPILEVNDQYARWQKLAGIK